MNDELIILKSVPKVKWANSHTPICLEHNMVLDGGYFDDFDNWENSSGTWVVNLRCLEGPHFIGLPMPVGDIRSYIRRKLESKQYAEAKLIDLDGLLVPVSKKERIATSDGSYFVTTQIKNGKRGDQVVIYAGKTGSAEKAQIFIDPEHKKMSFDQNNLNPADVFAKAEVTFRDGTKHTIEAGEK